MRESARTDPREPQGSNPLGPPGPEARTRDGSDPQWSSGGVLFLFDPPNAANRARNSQ